MKTRYKIIISVFVGLVAMLLYSYPMWWGTMFSPIMQQLTSTPVTDELTKGICMQTEGFVFRFRGLDLLMDLFKKF